MGVLTPMQWYQCSEVALLSGSIATLVCLNLAMVSFKLLQGRAI